MGELLQYAREKKQRLQEQKQFIQTFNMSELNAKIDYYNAMIDWLKDNGG